MEWASLRKGFVFIVHRTQKQQVGRDGRTLAYRRTITGKKNRAAFQSASRIGGRRQCSGLAYPIRPKSAQGALREE